MALSILRNGLRAERVLKTIRWTLPFPIHVRLCISVLNSKMKTDKFWIRRDPLMDGLILDLAGERDNGFVRQLTLFQTVTYVEP